MNAVLQMLKGAHTLTEALQARVDLIVETGKRSAGYGFHTDRGEGYVHTVVYPEYAAREADAASGSGDGALLGG